MAVSTPPYVQQGQTHTAALFRQNQAILLGTPAATVFAGGIQATTAGGGHGVAGAADLTVTQNTGADMNCKVSAGYAIVTGTENASQATYGGYNDASATFAVAASDPTNPRKDLVVMKVRDAFYSGASTDISLAVVTGTAAAVPADPTIPANALVLARILVPAASTAVTNANITDLRTRSYALGGVAVVASASLRPTGASLYAGLRCYAIAEQTEYLYDGTGWIIMSEPAQAWTPTIAGVTTTSGTWTSYYHRQDGWCDYVAELVFGASTAITADVLLTLPVSFHAITIGQHDGSFYDSSGGASYPLMPGFTGTTNSVWFRAMNTAGTYAVQAALSATVPVAYGTSDRLTFRGRGRMTTRYT